MAREFNKIGLIGRKRSSESIDSLKLLGELLSNENYDVILEADTASFLPDNTHPIYHREQFGKMCDLVIVIGGDGSMLNAASAVVDHDTPVLGINRARLGFLTDIHPDDLKTRVKEILDGEYIKEKRFLLNIEIRDHDKVIHSDIALNEVVLLAGEFAHMLEFEVYINSQLVCSQRADGQIIATPTGSTAYALSAGGPILHPKLNAIVLVPMSPHTLSSRPIVIDSSSKIDIVPLARSETSPQISCDGQKRIPIAAGHTLHISRKTAELTLLHPKNYNYYKRLRKKLFWEKKLS